jgi:hypothetical protein
MPVLCPESTLLNCEGNSYWPTVVLKCGSTVVLGFFVGGIVIVCSIVTFRSTIILLLAVSGLHFTIFHTKVFPLFFFFE